MFTRFRLFSLMLIALVFGVLTAGSRTVFACDHAPAEHGRSPVSHDLSGPLLAMPDGCADLHDAGTGDCVSPCPHGFAMRPGEGVPRAAMQPAEFRAPELVGALFLAAFPPEAPGLRMPVGFVGRIPLWFDPGERPLLI